MPLLVVQIQNLSHWRGWLRFDTAVAAFRRQMQYPLSIQSSVKFQRSRGQQSLGDFQQTVGNIAEIPVDQQGLFLLHI